jgi:mono/diheme cytochrome c family protein
MLLSIVLAGVAALNGNGLRAQTETPAAAMAEPSIERGAYIFRAAGCLTCHTDAKNKGAPLAGGRAFETPYGTFYSPNITPDKDQGIGAWSEDDFLRALREGIAPDGSHYYPAFPYTSYTGMSERDMRDLKAYIFSRAPAATPSRPHELKFPFKYRILMWPWKLLFFDEGRRVEDPSKDSRWNRGAYLTEHLGHCGECHTPRNFLGAVKRDRVLGGNPSGPDGRKVPNITPHPERGIGGWSQSDVTFFLESGFLPDGDFAGGAMTDVIEESTSHLSDEDRQAIAIYLFSLPPVE